jgi:thymidylate synthase
MTATPPIIFDLCIQFPNPKNDIGYILSIMREIVGHIRDPIKLFRIQVFNVIKQLILNPTQISPMINVWFQDEITENSLGTLCQFHIKDNRLHTIVCRRKCRLLLGGEYMMVYFSLLALMLAHTMSFPIGTITFVFDQLYLLDQDQEIFKKRNERQMQPCLIHMIKQSLILTMVPNWFDAYNLDFIVFQYLSYLSIMKADDFDIQELIIN